MHLTATDFYTLTRPSRCDRRVYLRAAGAEEAPASPFDEILKRLGERHEKEHLATLPEAVDVSQGTREERIARTKEAVHSNAPVIYQPALETTLPIGGTHARLVGDPDFFILKSEGYVIRDAKLSRRITEEDHPEIIKQVNAYGVLFEHAFGTKPAALEVLNGMREIIHIPYAGLPAIQVDLEILIALKEAAQEPYSPVGWSKCEACPFKGHCWPKAEEERSAALIYGVDQSLATSLHLEGIDTIAQVLENFTPDTLSEYRRPRGERMQRVGKAAESILRMAKAMQEGREIVIQAPDIPKHDNYVMFDLEGMPPHMDELDKIYLWGLQVYGKKPGTYLTAVAGFGPDGEKQGWQKFLEQSNAIFAEYGDIPFVHWHSYEKTHIQNALERYGDPGGIGTRVLGNLLDLLPITRDSIAVPLPSYSLKVIEKYVGFKRTQDEYGGAWSIAKFIEATETEDEDARANIMTDILTYNEEDLKATWAVLQWLRSHLN